MKQGLLVIDVQNDYFAGGKMVLNGADEALRNINLLAAQFIAAKLPIIYIQHIKHQKNADFFEQGTSGAELHPKLKIDAASIVIEKHFPNSFLKTTLAEVLKKHQIDQLVICGMMTHMCIRATTPAAADLGYYPILIADATATKDLILAGFDIPADQVQADIISELSLVADIQTTSQFVSAFEQKM